MNSEYVPVNDLCYQKLAISKRQEHGVAEDLRLLYKIAKCCLLLGYAAYVLYITESAAIFTFVALCIPTVAWTFMAMVELMVYLVRLVDCAVIYILSP